MLQARVTLVARLRQRLLSEVAVAGWGYYSGKASRIEPTCWALLALDASTPPGEAPIANHGSHVAFLSGLQGRDGLLLETDPALANLASNGLAAIVLARAGGAPATTAASRLLAGLTDLRGVRLEQSDSAQDNRLQGWPWVRDTFSWVEPTAWCLLALKLEPQPAGSAEASAARVREAEALMLNRVCRGGGWNYGNASTLGQELRAYVPTTGIGVMAMQDRAGESAVRESVERLFTLRITERSTFALSLTAMALRLHGRPVDDVEDAIAEAVVRSESAGHVMPIAMALYALTADEHNMEALRVRA